MILFAGDPHGSYDHIYPFVREQENVSLIILGDLNLRNIVIFGLFMEIMIAKQLVLLMRFGVLNGNHGIYTIA